MSSQDHFELMIPGATSSAGNVDVTAPYDGSQIATVERADGPAVDQALKTAYGLFRNRDSWLPPPKRIEILSRTTEIMKSRREELAREAAREGGKPLVDSLVEVDRAIDSVHICIETLRTEQGNVIPMNVTPSSANRFAATRREPIGVVVAVSAFNHPLNLIAHQVAPAIAVGCPVVVKPAQVTPLSCLRFVQMLREAGLPDEWCQPAITAGRDVATQLVTDARVAFFSFIGSAKVGWMLNSKLAPGARAALEHGGPAPAIIMADADFDVTVPSVLKGGFYHAGQVCVSVQRVFADQAIAEDFAAQLAAGAEKLRVGDPTLADTEVGPLISPAEVDRVADWVEEARAAGARVLSGGKKISDTCYEPTVLIGAPNDTKISTLEVFGPVVTIYPYTNVDDAIAQANSLPFAFQAAVYTTNVNGAMRAFARLDASAIMINDHTAFRVDWMPFAGIRQSGLGVGGVPYTMHEMQVEKMMVIKSPEL